jgi:hypothetical protein
MIRGLLAAPVLALALGGCGGGSSDMNAATAAYCPQPMTVADAQRLVRFRDGPGRDPRDIVFEAEIAPGGVGCSRRTNQMEVDMDVRIVVTAGPAVGAATVSVPYFVRVLDGSGRVVQGQDFLADFKFTPASPRAGSKEELKLRLPYQQLSDVAAYRIAIGLKPTQQELQYNRRAAAR